MEKWKEFFACPLPADMQPGFSALLARNIRRISGVLVPLILTFELGNIIRIFWGQKGGLGTTARRVYFTMYLLLFLATAAAAAGMLLFARSKGEKANRRIIRLSVAYAAFISVWSLGVTLYDQRVTENVTVYVGIILPVAVLIYLKPWQALAIFGGCQIALLALLPAFQPAPINNAGNYVNTTVIAVMAFLIAASRYRGRARDYRNWMTIARQAAEIQRMNQSLSVKVFTDGLTRMHNRRYLEELLPKRWEQARERQEPVGILMIDIDDFKRYNDTYGHQAGDDCIRRIAAVIRSCTDPEQDCLVRYGGEEFLVVLFGRDGAAVKEAGERIRAGVEASQIPCGKHSGTGVVTISAGACSAPGDVPTEELIGRADSALYRAKAEGKNRVICC
ncbi:MAG: GGDEF domain-containing protein [Candidatus Merdivicinus sp.]